MDNAKAGRKIRIYRNCAELTRAELAKRLGISASAVSMYERAQRRPTDEVKEKYANYFKVTVQELFYD